MRDDGLPDSATGSSVTTDGGRPGRSSRHVTSSGSHAGREVGQLRMPDGRPRFNVGSSTTDGGKHGSIRPKTVLSDKLAELSTRAKEAEGRAAAARGKSRPTFKRTPRPRERMLRPELRSCANPLRRTRTSSRFGGRLAAHVERARREGSRRVDTKRAEHDSDRAERRAEHRADDACSRSSSRTRRSRRRSTQCSTPNWRGRRRTSCPRLDLQLSGARPTRLPRVIHFELLRSGPTLSCCAGSGRRSVRRLHRASAARGSDRLVRPRPRAASTGGCSPSSCRNRSSALCGGRPHAGARLRAVAQRCHGPDVPTMMQSLKSCE